MWQNLLLPAAEAAASVGDVAGLSAMTKDIIVLQDGCFVKQIGRCADCAYLPRKNLFLPGMVIRPRLLLLLRVVHLLLLRILHLLLLQRVMLLLLLLSAHGRAPRPCTPSAQD